MLMPPVSRYMTLHPLAIGARAKLSAARALMRREGIHHLPVLEEDALVGIVSDRDLHPIHPLHDACVADAMTEPVVTVRAEASLDDAVTLMQERGCSSVLVVGDEGLEGIFTTSDALRALGDLLHRTVEDQP